MIKGIGHFFCFTISIWLILFLTTFWSGFKPFYYFEYHKNDIMHVTKMDAESIDIAIDRLSGYLSEKYPELNAQVTIDGRNRLLFNEKEILHMIDVKHLIVTSRRICGVYAVLLIVYYLILHRLERRNEFLRKLGKWALGGMVLILVLGLGAVFIDFSAAFIQFHHIFFTNDLWLLDPSTDVLIQMLPEVFFRDITIMIFMNALLIAIVFYIVGVKKWSN